MFTVDFPTISVILSIIGVLTGGAIWVLSLIYRVSSQITNEKNRINALEKNHDDLKKITEKEKEENEAFRHKYKTSLDQMRELFKIQMESLQKSIESTKEILLAKIDLALKDKKHD